MHYVSLIVEFLRGRPAVVFWTAALAQAALWVIVPSLFFSAPPGEVPLLLAIGHEFRLGSHLGPPLAFWLGEAAFNLLGIFGVYLLAQICVVVALWAVFALGRAIIGVRHAVLAVLLMVGIFAFTVPTPEFGPAILALPFWALALLHSWRVLGEDRRGYWFLLAVDLGLLLLTTYAGVLLLVLLAFFAPLTRRGREAFLHVEPWIAIVLLVLVVLPHGLWLYFSFPEIRAAFLEGGRIGDYGPALSFAGALLVSHLGALVLILLASGWRLRRDERAPEISRAPADRAGR
ncbi:MAG: glycosyltransferase family 39 protein, partial [Pseudolabrys sp.]|nr:glycosyltransferase family 39 protein [Pseudolabrys sp.]